MKRGAEALDEEDATARGNRASNHSYKQPNHKRIRQGDRDRSHNGKDVSGRDNSDGKGPIVKTLADEKETDLHRLAQRQKQIDYGKNTIGYDHYCAQVPRHQRRPGKHPMTPDKTRRIGKKVFDGMVRRWRQMLHKYDPPELAEAIATGKDGIAGATDAKVDEGDATTCSSESTATSAEPEMAKEAVAPLPSRSIYENFDDDNFDEEAESDDDLL